ncbi:MAG TPA: hypothetical protein VG756_12480 [Pseudonocardiaceae bacterium]|nr:hypothetical protein [Pseudonocardiaceae bacterium]
MFTHRGIGLATWASVDEDCSLSCEVIGDQAQFDVGHATGMLHLVVDQGALARLAEITAEALSAWRATPHGEKVCVILPSAPAQSR